MCIENQTIGFICNCYKDIVEINRQYNIGKYKVDLYFPQYKLIVECDENNHIDRCKIKEKEREDFIKSFGNKLIRYNPNEMDFDVSNVLQKINKIIFVH
jgi:very-short-patch-repair endonuclease